MRQIFIIGLIIFFSILQLKAQSDFRSGFIINNNNDTIYGLIDYGGNKANARKCTFRKDINSEIQYFYPNEIKCFRFNDSKYYVSMSVNVENNTEQLFLEYLINGIVDVYYYRDCGEHYLVDNGSGNLYSLETEVKEVKIGNVTYTGESKKYVGVLKAVFMDSPSISSRAENIKINHKSLIDITRDYHEQVCTDKECIIYEKKLPKAKRTYGFVMGLNGILISQTGDFDDDVYYLKNSQFRFVIYPSIGLFFKTDMPFVNERLYFQYEVAYSRMHLTANSSYIEPLYNMNFLSDISMTLNAFNNLGYIRYVSPTGKIRPTYHLGGFVNYYFKTDYSRYLEVKNPLGNTTYTGYKNESPFSKLDFGVNLGCGLMINYLKDKELLLDFRYQRGFGWLASTNANTNVFMINAGFQIGE